MGDPVDLDLAALNHHRAELRTVEAKQTKVGADLADGNAALALLLREGASASAVAKARNRIVELEQSRQDLHDRRTDLLTTVDQLGNDLVLTVDPSVFVASLDATRPVAMLPVRIETRFSANRTSLNIRIFPDQIHLDGHEPEFTDDEEQGAMWYWEQRWPHLDDAALADAAWRTLASRFRPGRARYLIDRYRPANIDGAPTGSPNFASVERRASSWTRAVQARALPSQWVAVGYQGGAEVFRVWSKAVASALATGPTPSKEEEPPPLAPDATTPRVQDALKWAVDFQVAVDAGMALTVSDTQLASNHLLANGLSRLLVLGVDWSQTADDGAAALSALLAGHAATGDLAFVAPGTPTNNTGVNRSGFSTAPSDQVAEWAPPVAGDDPDIAPEVAAGRLAGALGIPAAPLAVAPGASGHHLRTESALVDALWEASGGYYASDLLDPIGSDPLTNALREHASTHLHPSGPLPAIRIGPQPYGVLPVVARSYAATPGNRAEEAISRVGNALRSLWEPLVSRVPHLGRAGEQRDVDAIMLDLLQRTPVPWTMRWREMIPPPQWSSTDWMTTFRIFQAPYLETVMTMLGVSNVGAAKVQYLTATKENNPLTVPLVLKGDEGTSYLAEIAALTNGGADGRRELNLRQNSLALLEALLAFAATQELDKAAHAVHTNGLTADEVLAAGVTKLGVRTPDLVRVEDAPTDLKQLQFTTARALAATTAPNTNVLVHDELALHMVNKLPRDMIVDTFAPIRTLGRFLAALDELKDASADEIEWALRGVLDLYSTRLDAWFTSLATSRLAQQRAVQPAGVHIGCYGWVEDLGPDSGAAAESLGHVLAPSLAHAVAAAVLRSGRQAHAGTNAFDIDLSSRRVREAMAMLEGVASGQSIAALVGYRIERRLREAQLADLTVPLRLVAPMKSRDVEHDTPLESVAARDVVDGVRLLTLFSAGGTAWTDVVTTIGATSRQAQLEAVLTEVASNYDAVTDVLFAETMHQTAEGNLERASAAAGALDRQEQPVQPEVIRTPRAGAVVTNRVLVSLGQKTPAPGWPARGPRGTMEPRLDHWLGVVLGPPGELGMRGRLVRPSSVEGADPVITDLGVVSAADLGLSPLALVLTAQRPSAGGLSELEHRVVNVLQQRVTHPTAADRIECEHSSLLHTVTDWAARLVGGSRALAPTDLVLAQSSGTVLAGTVDIDDLTARVKAAVTAIGKATTALSSVAQTVIALRRALTVVGEIVGAEAVPVVASGAADENDQLRAQVTTVTELLTTRRAALVDLAGKPFGPSDNAVSRQLEIAALALGAQQPVLPLFTLAAPAELAASVGDRAHLLAGDETALVAWLNRMSLVRPEMEPLSGLLSHAEANGHDIVADVAVAQLPRVETAPWCELPFGAAGPPTAGTIGMVVVAPGGLNPTKPLAGLFVDAFAEVIPSTEHTAGLSFHYDAPGARPPQAIVLAVHPQPAPTTWDLDTLIATVNETAALAQLRTLSLKEIEGFSGLIPALYLPNNYTRDVPSVSFKDLMIKAQARDLVKVFTGVKGK